MSSVPPLNPPKKSGSLLVDTLIFVLLLFIAPGRKRRIRTLREKLQGVQRVSISTANKIIILGHYGKEPLPAKVSEDCPVELKEGNTRLIEI